MGELAVIITNYLSLHPATETGYRNFLRFDIAGMVFILLAHLGLCLSFLWVHKFMPYVLVGL